MLENLIGGIHVADAGKLDWGWGHTLQTVYCGTSGLVNNWKGLKCVNVSLARWVAGGVPDLGTNQVMLAADLLSFVD